MNPSRYPVISMSSVISREELVVSSNTGAIPTSTLPILAMFRIALLAFLVASASAFAPNLAPRALRNVRAHVEITKGVEVSMPFLVLKFKILRRKQRTS